MSVYINPGFAVASQGAYKPRICYQAHAGTAAATSTVAGASVAWVQDGQTWNAWKPASVPATLSITFPAPVLTDYIAIAAHTLDLTGATIGLQFNSGGGLATAINITPTDGGPILFFFEARLVSAVAVVISGGVGLPEIAVFQAGLSMEVPQRSTFTGVGISESDQIGYRYAQSVRGDVLGQELQSSGMSFDINIAHLSEEYRAGAWQGFKSHIISGGPFFVASKPLQYPDDVAYARVTELPRFERTMPNKLVSGTVNLQCRGYRRP